MEVEQLISSYQEKGVELKNKNWIPVAISAALLLPVWNRITILILDEINEMNMAIIILLTIIFGFIVWFLVSIRDLISYTILQKSYNYLKLASIIQLVKCIRDKEK